MIKFFSFFAASFLIFCLLEYHSIFIPFHEKLCLTLSRFFLNFFLIREWFFNLIACFLLRNSVSWSFKRQTFETSLASSFIHLFFFSSSLALTAKLSLRCVNVFCLYSHWLRFHFMRDQFRHPKNFFLAIGTIFFSLFFCFVNYFNKLKKIEMKSV